MQLRLQSMVVHNFKSYRGTHVIDNLDPRFTAVIGPNGSGKSNIIDSILFVLGFRARKMRHASLADLIYSGEAKEDMCYVELCFNRFRIRREAHVSRRSRYFVDGDELSAAEVSALLGNEGVDMEHNRFLILQGEIESIAMMKPMGDGLLEYLEDVVGTSQYKEAIEKNEGLAEQMEDEYETRSGTAKFYLKELQHAEERRSEGVRLVRKKVEVLRQRRRVADVSIEMHGRAVERCTREKKEIEKRVGELRKKNDENTCRLDALEKEGREARNVLKRAENELLGVKREYQRAERDRRLVDEDRTRLEKQIRALEEQIEDMRSKEEMRRAELSAYNREIEQNSAEIERYSIEAEELRHAVQREQEKINKKAKKNVDAVRRGEARVIELLRRKATVGEELGRRETELGLLASRREEIAREMHGIEEQLRAGMSVGRSEAEIEEEIRSIEKDLGLTQKEIAKRMQRADEQKENEERDSQEGEILRHIKMKGVHGRLRDLGSVDPKYEAALRAAGKTLNSIVVDTTATAEECIALIRKKNLSRATFVILDKIGTVPSLPKEPVPYLHALVECKEELRKCFYFALKDTLVCEDLESAEKIAFGRQRKRVVTVDGKLIEKSGVMSGGKSGKVRRVDDLEQACGKMRELKSRRIEELNAVRRSRNKASLEATRGRLNEELKDVAECIRSAEKKVDRGEIEAIDDEIGRIKKEIAEARDGIERLVDTEMRSRRAGLQILNEKIELFERRNLELKVHLNTDTGCSLEEREGEAKEKRKALKKIVVRDISGLKDALDRCECEYREKLNDLKVLQDGAAGVKGELGSDYHAEIDLKNRLDDIDEQIQTSSRTKRELGEAMKKLDAEIERYQALCKTDEEETVDPSGLEDEDEDVEEIVRRECEKLKKLEKDESGEVDARVFEDYERARSEHGKAKEEFEWIRMRVEGLKDETEGLRKRRLEEFMSGFEQISRHLKEIYKAITYGGNAELELVDYLDPFSEGIVLSVMPPKKSWKNVSNLSGGEKTLSSLALIFALHRYRPSPFYVMDEVDAALDYRNVSVISSYIKEMSLNAQFVVVSLRNDMFEQSNTLLGVYKTSNVSRFLVVNIDGLKLN